VTLPSAVAVALREYARARQIPLSTIIELACAAYLEERAARADQAPLRLRLRERRGPLASVERQLSETALSVLRARGGRRL
jgi:hypothetical protein